MGNALGGSSIINSMLYSRGDYKVYDEWERLGNADWSSSKIMKYFIKSENNTDFANLDRKYHGNKGPLTISPPSAPSIHF